MDEKVIVYSDKSMLKITGIKVKGLRPPELEAKLQEVFKRPVRLIGVTGDKVEMDVYGLDGEALLQKADGVVKAISFVEGITASNVVEIASSERSIEVDIEQARRRAQEPVVCGRERWLKPEQEE
jgi:hypothetical protein